QKTIGAFKGCIIRMNYTRIGDNRAYVQIGSSVAAAAGKMGANSLLQFAHMVRKSEIDWRELTFDGIISALETNNFTEEELLEIWKKAVDYFALNKYAEPYDNTNTRRKIYCADIHEAIRLCAKRLNYYELDNKMSKVAQLEYEQTRLERSEHSCIIPNRWYESEYYPYMNDFLRDTEQMTLDEMFSFIEMKFEQNDFYWDYVKFFIQKAKNTEPQYILKYKPHIMKMLDEREMNNLYYDGCNRLYEVFFQYMDEDEITGVLKRIIDTYYHYKNKGWESIDFGLMNDLDDFTFSLFSRFTLEDNIRALHIILKMHCLWLSGTETLKVKEVYQLNNIGEIKGWCDFCNELDNIGEC
ncbi:MAG: hypothetical protein NC121_01850, partial [Blautia sp.]|nr:hypothetical protein [Blautia sp.]